MRATCEPHVSEASGHYYKLMHHPKLDAGLIILAAGGGRRAGGPKALKAIDGRPALILWAESYAQTLRGPVIAVVSPTVYSHLDAGAPQLDPPHLKMLINPTPETSGAADSLLIALNELPPNTPTFITPIDCPPVEPRTLELLWAALQEGAQAAIPTHANQEGHPILLSPSSCLAYRAAPTRLDHFLSNSISTQQVAVKDPAVLRNLNTADQWEHLSIEGAPCF